MNTAPQDLLLQLLEPAHRANPYPVYRQLREQAPLQLPEFSLLPSCRPQHYFFPLAQSPLR